MYKMQKHTKLKKAQQAKVKICLIAKLPDEQNVIMPTKNAIVYQIQKSIKFTIQKVNIVISAKHA